ncbi:hypothetical protein C8J57DRAFT_1562067 [Mycena rebaudengoi]|nr:hypothetical protein C8J57DRAFT_1562067 [Mycena rebaudengoi]
MAPAPPTFNLFQINGPWAFSGTLSLATDDSLPRDNIIQRAVTPGFGLLNNTVLSTLKPVLLVPMVLDALLHSGAPDSTAPLVARADERPDVSQKECTTFSSQKGLFTISKSHRLFCEVQAINAPANVDLQSMADYPRKRCLNFIKRRYNATNSPGDITQYNIEQAAFMLTAILEGNIVKFNKEAAVDTAWVIAKRHDATIERAEVGDVLHRPNLYGIMAALAVVVGHGPLYLLIDNNFATEVWNPRIDVFKSWLAAGNAHRVDVDHPLGRLERKLWPMLFSVVVDILDNPPLQYLDA